MVKSRWEVNWLSDRLNLEWIWTAEAVDVAVDRVVVAHDAVDVLSVVLQWISS